MVTYSLKHSNGQTYTIEGPEGKTQQEVIDAIMKQINSEQSTFGLRDPVTVPESSKQSVSEAINQTREILSGETNTIDYLDEREQARSLLEENDTTYDLLRDNEEVRQASMRFLYDRLGMENVHPDDAVDEMIEHFRRFNVNEVRAAGDFQYVSALNADNKMDKLKDYRLVRTAFKALPELWQEGSAPGATMDYIKGILTAPSTYAGILIPVKGKVAGQAVTKASALGVASILNAMKPTSIIAAASANPIKTTIAVEGLSGLAQDVAAQNTDIEAQLQDDYSIGQNVGAFVLSAAPAGALTYFGKGRAVAYIERNTGDIVETSQKAILDRIGKASNETDKLFTGKFKKENINVASQISNALVKSNPNLAPLNQTLVTKGLTTLKGITGDKNLYKNADVIEPLGLKMDVNSLKFRNLTGALTEILTKGGRKFDPNVRITEQLADVLRKDIDKDEVSSYLGNFLQKYNLTTDDVANVFMAEVSEAGRALQMVGQSKKDITKFISSLEDVASYDLFGFDKKAVENIKKANKTASNTVRNKVTEAGIFRQLDQARLAFMTSQVATTVRNTVSGYTRVGFDVLTRSIEKTVQNVTGTAPTGPNDDIFAIAYGLANRKESQAVKELFESGFAGEASKLFRALIDVEDVTNGRLSRLHGVSRQLNALNTLSDNMFKQAALTGELKRKLNVMASKALDSSTKIKTGKDAGKLTVEGLGNIKFANAQELTEHFDLIKIMSEGRFNQVFGTSKEGQEALKDAVQRSLDFTYQRTFNNDLARLFSKVVHAVPFVGTNAVPFPRFMMNAMKFTYDHSPLNHAMYKEAYQAFLDPAPKEIGQRYENIAKGTLGYGLLMAATAFRMSEFAGDEWYTGKTSSGQRYDLRPMFPAAPYLFVGDMFARYLKGDPIRFDNKKTVLTAAQTFTGSNLRTGFGVVGLENLINKTMEADADNTRELETLATEFVSNIITTFTIPATILQDTYNTFLAPDDERILRDTNSKDMFTLGVNRILSRIPANYAIEKYLEKTLGKDVYTAPQPLVSPTTQEKIRRKNPITRQLAGVLFREKLTVVEEELERLRISRFQVYPRTRDPEVDAIVAFHMQRYMAEDIANYIENSKIYNDINIGKSKILLDAGLSKSKIQKELLLDKITRFRTVAKEEAKAWSIGSSDSYPMEREAFRKQPETIRALAQELYHRKFGEPSENRGYNYKALEFLTEQARKMTGMIQER
tara:strand:- start:53 stop:3703 length:3651 start_codon:yes stop_codon:yes gene_type:complete